MKLGVSLMLYLGLRQGEVAARVARDIDDDGRVLWVPSGKTKNARCTRRLHSKGATGNAVAKALGHGSFEKTKTHYAGASSVANNEAGRVAAALAGISKEEKLLKLLKKLPTNELDRLLLGLRSGCQSGQYIEENGIT